MALSKGPSLHVLLVVVVEFQRHRKVVIHSAKVYLGEAAVGITMLYVLRSSCPPQRNTSPDHLRLSVAQLPDVTTAGAQPMRRPLPLTARPQMQLKNLF